MALPSATDVEYVGSGTSGGVAMGRASTDKIGFYATTPVAQRSGSAQSAVGTASSTATSPYGFATSTQADAIVTLVNEIRATLVANGMIAGS